MGGPATRTAADLHAVLTLGAAAGLSDDALLDLFEGAGEAADRAFEVLIARHGPLVLRAARGRLGSEADAHDAFQATFWLLARRSRSIRNRAALASWLFGVASRVAARARSDAARRAARERHAAVPEADPTRDPARRDPELMPAIQDEIARLPRTSRVALILVDLEGLSAAEAAHRLGCPVGTFKARLSRGRARLRNRLARRGLAPAGWEAPRSCPSVVPSALIQVTSRLVRDATAGHLPTVSASIFALTRGVPRTMTFASISPWALVGSTGLIAIASGLIGSILGEPAPVPPHSVPALNSVVVGPDQRPASSPPPPVVTKPVPPVVDRAPQPPEPMPAEPALVAAAGPVVTQITRDAEALTDLEDKARLLLRLGRWQTRRGDRTAARETLMRARAAAAAIPIRADGSLPRTIVQVGEAQAEAGAPEAARQTFDATIPIIRRLPVERMEEFYNALLAAERRTLPRAASQPTIDAYKMFEAYGGVHMARTVLDWGGRPAGFGGEVEGGDIGIGYGTPKLAEAARALEGDFAGAFRRIDEVWTSTELPNRPDGKLEAMTAIAQALRPEDGALIPEVLGKVRQAVREAPTSREKNGCLLALMDVAIRLGRFDEAAALVLQAPTNSPLMAHNLMELIVAQAKAGDSTVARRLIRETLIVIHSTDRTSLNQATLVIQFAPLVARVGDLDLAIDLAGSLPLYTRYVALSEIFRDRQAAGDAEGVRRVRDRLVAVVRQAIGEREGATPRNPEGSRISWLVRLAGLTADPADIRAAHAGVATYPPELQQRYFPSLAAALARAGQFGAAVDVAGRITAAKDQGQALLAVLNIELDRVRPASIEISPHEWPWVDAIR